MIIIGAGPAGLAVAATVRQLGLRPTVLERSAEIGSSWAGRYDSLHLHTVRWLSGLPGMPIPRRYGRWVSRDDLAQYLRAYADRFSIEPELGVSATRIERSGGGWAVQTDTGPRQASVVVVATGYSQLPYVPDWPGLDSFVPPLVHSSRYRNAAAYAGRHILVVGAGNSAAEIASELATAGAQVDLSVRTPPNIIRRTTLGMPSQLIGLATKRVPEPLMNPLAGVLRRLSVPDLSSHGLPPPADGFTQFLRTRTVPVLDHGFVGQVRAGGIRIVAAVESLTSHAVVLADGSTVEPDAVVCATGFRPGLEPMVGHLGVLDDRGMPLVRGGQTMPGVPHLHFAGISIELSGLLREIGLEARAIGRAVAQQRP